MRKSTEICMHKSLHVKVSITLSTDGVTTWKENVFRSAFVYNALKRYVGHERGVTYSKERSYSVNA